MREEDVLRGRGGEATAAAEEELGVLPMVRMMVDAAVGLLVLM